MKNYSFAIFPTVVSAVMCIGSATAMSADADACRECRSGEKFVAAGNRFIPGEEAIDAAACHLADAVVQRVFGAGAEFAMGCEVFPENAMACHLADAVAQRVFGSSAKFAAIGCEAFPENATACHLPDAGEQRLFRAGAEFAMGCEAFLENATACHLADAGAQRVFGAGAAPDATECGALKIADAAVYGLDDATDAFFARPTDADRAFAGSNRAGVEAMHVRTTVARLPQSPAQPSTDARATEILEGVVAAFRAMPSYGVDFRVEAAEYSARGNYAVEGERYYIGLGDAKVYCDGAIRYEVDNRRREITLNEVDTESRNLLNNPVHAFDFLGSQYAATLVSEQQGRAVVRLTPTDATASPAGEVTLTVDTATMKPLSLAYDYDGERIGIEILSVAPLSTSLSRFDATNYLGYETIDFR